MINSTEAVTKLKKVIAKNVGIKDIEFSEVLFEPSWENVLAVEARSVKWATRQLRVWSIIGGVLRSRLYTQSEWAKRVHDASKEGNWTYQALN